MSTALRSFPAWPSFPTATARSPVRVPAWSLSARPAHVYKIDTTRGNDANPGTLALPWKTDVPLRALGALTAAAWKDAAAAAADLSTIASDALKLAWYNQLLAGNRRLAGGTLLIVDTIAAPLVMSGAWSLIGCEVVSARNALTDIRINKTLVDIWTRPDAAGAPHVWATTGTSYAGTGLSEGTGVANRKQLKAIIGANFAAVKATLESTAGSFYADPATGILYTHAIADGNPNTDGIAREYLPAWAVALNGGRAIDVQGGRAKLIGTDGGFGLTCADGLLQGCAGIGAGEFNTITVIDSCQATGCGKHSMSFVGTSGAGLAIARNNVCGLGPAGLAFANWTHYVDYTSFSGTGTINTIYDGNQTLNGVANLNATGGTDADPSYQAYTEHTNDNTPAFRRVRFQNNVLRGIVSPGIQIAKFESIDDQFLGGIRTDAVVNTFTASGAHTAKIGYFMPGLGHTGAGGTSTLTGIDITPGSVFTGGPSGLSGTATLTNCNIDLSAANIYSSAWQRSAAIAGLTISGGTLNLGGGNVAYGLVYGTAPGDVLLLTGALAVTSTGNGFALTFDANSTFNALSSIKLFCDAAARGWIDGTVLVNGAAYTALAGLTVLFRQEAGTAHTWKDTAGTQAVSANNDAVARRDDLSGNGLNWTQATAGSRPTWNSATNNIHWDGAGHSLAGGAFTLAGAWTAFIDLNRAVGATFGMFSGSANANHFIGGGDGNNLYIKNNSGLRSVVWPQNARLLLRLRRDASNAIKVKGGPAASDPYSGAEQTLATGTLAGTLILDTQGTWPGGGGYNLTGDLGGCLFIAGDLHATGGEDAAVVCMTGLANAPAFP